MTGRQIPYIDFAVACNNDRTVACWDNLKIPVKVDAT